MVLCGIFQYEYSMRCKQREQCNVFISMKTFEVENYWQIEFHMSCLLAKGYAIFLCMIILEHWKLSNGFHYTSSSVCVLVKWIFQNQPFFFLFIHPTLCRTHKLIIPQFGPILSSFEIIICWLNYCWCLPVPCLIVRIIVLCYQIKMVCIRMEMKLRQRGLHLCVHIYTYLPVCLSVGLSVSVCVCF